MRPVSASSHPRPLLPGSLIKQNPQIENTFFFCFGRYSSVDGELVDRAWSSEFDPQHCLTPNVGLHPCNPSNWKKEVGVREVQSHLQKHSEDKAKLVTSLIKILKKWENTVPLLGAAYRVTQPTPRTGFQAPTPNRQGRVSGHTLASCLSGFLWAVVPWASGGVLTFRALQSSPATSIGPSVWNLSLQCSPALLALIHFLLLFSA